MSTAPALKKRKTVASKKLISFQAQETHYVLDDPASESMGRYISTNKELRYAISPWEAGKPRKGWLGEGSMKLGVVVGLYSLFIFIDTCSNVLN